MYYKATIYDPEDGFDQILAAVSKFNAERFLYAIRYKNCDERQLERMAVEVTSYRQKLEVEPLIVKQVIESSKGTGITPTEVALFGENEDRVHRCRNIILHFDDLIPAKYRRTKMPARYVQMFFQLVDIPYKLEAEAVKYFNEIYLSAEGHRFQTVSYQAVNACKKEVLADKDGAFNVFQQLTGRRIF